MPARKKSQRRKTISKTDSEAKPKRARKRPVAEAKSLQAAEEYLSRGYSPIPLPPGGKAPEIKDWPKLRLKKDELRKYFGGRCNVGLLLGEPSNGLVDVDLDADEVLLVAEELLPATNMVSGRESRPRSHYWYRAENAVTRRFQSPDGTIVELRAGGAQTMVPPSVHPSGERVTWHEGGEPAVVGYDELLIAVSLLAAAVLLSKSWPAVGARHDASMALSGLLLRKGVDQTVLEKLIWAVATMAGDDEIDARVKSVASTQEAMAAGKPVTGGPKAVELIGAETIDLMGQWIGLAGGTDGSDGKNKKKSQADRLVELAAGFELFRAVGDDETGYAYIESEEKRETLPIESSKFRSLLKRAYWVKHQKAASTRALQGALGVIIGKAIYEGEEKPVFVRVGLHAGVIYVDLADEQQRVLHVTKGGWSIERDSPVRFIRPRGLQALPTPKEGGDIQRLRPFVNVEDGDDWILVLAWLTAALRPGFPCPILALHGEQGSAKSFTSKVVRSVIDPNVGDLRPQPGEARDLAIASKNSLVLCFDNISFLNREMADALCRLVTGGAFATRRLYSDAEEVLFEAKRPIILNGIPDLAAHSDLMDQMIPLTLPTIQASKRCTEKQLWSDFEEVRGEVLGGILDAVCCGLRNLASVHIEELPRMADFAAWGTAVEEALGCKPGGFMKAYTRSRRAATALTIEGSTMVKALRAFLLLRKAPFEGTATNLYQEMERSTVIANIVKGRRDWPKAPSSFGGKLRRHAPAMRQVGIRVTFERHSSKARTRTIRIELDRKRAKKASKRTGSTGPKSIGRAKRRPR